MNTTKPSTETVGRHRRSNARGLLAWSALLGLLLPLAPVTGIAAEVRIDPISIEMSPKQKTVAIKVGNVSKQSTSYQIKTVTWSQVDGKDVYTDTRELLVTPPLFTIAPDGEQIVRVALRRPMHATGELTYRIFLQELPVKPTADFSGLQVALRIGLPVFVAPQTGRAMPAMVWSAQRMSGDTVSVSLLNKGQAHVQVSDFALHATGSTKPIGGEAGSTYVLAGQTHTWLLKTDSTLTANPGPMRLTAFTDAGDVDVELPSISP